MLLLKQSKNNKKNKTETTYTPEAGLLATNIKDNNIRSATNIHLNSDINVGAQQSSAQ